MFFFFNDTATTEIYTLSLHDALPISRRRGSCPAPGRAGGPALPNARAAPSTAVGSGPSAPARSRAAAARPADRSSRSAEHTSELPSRLHLVCRPLLEKKKTTSLHAQG